MSLPAAVVFDCDGVLVDSEPHSIRAWMDVLFDHSHPGTEADVVACTGLGFEPTRDHLAALGSLPTPGVLWPEVLAALGRSFDRGLERFDDAMTLLDALERRGLPAAVATASPRERFDLTLGAAGLRDRFVTTVAGDEVASSKPAPDVYLEASRRLGVAAETIVAIEDTPTGVAAAVAAGMRTIGVDRDGLWRSDLEETGATVVDRLTWDVLIG